MRVLIFLASAMPTFLPQQKPNPTMKIAFALPLFVAFTSAFSAAPNGQRRSTSLSAIEICEGVEFGKHGIVCDCLPVIEQYLNSVMLQRYHLPRMALQVEPR